MVRASLLVKDSTYSLSATPPDFAGLAQLAHPRGRAPSCRWHRTPSGLHHGALHLPTRITSEAPNKSVGVHTPELPLSAFGTVGWMTLGHATPRRHRQVVLSRGPSHNPVAPRPEVIHWLCHGGHDATNTWLLNAKKQGLCESRILMGAKMPIYIACTGMKGSVFPHVMASVRSLRARPHRPRHGGHWGTFLRSVAMRASGCLEFARKLPNVV